jgi:hypothetical protein
MKEDDIAKPIAPELIERKFKRDPFIPQFDQLAPYRAYERGYEGREWEPQS